MRFATFVMKMLNSLSIVRASITPLLAIFIHSNIHAQERPVQTMVQEVKGEAQTVEVEGNYIPIFWRANIGSSIVNVPIRNIEFYGVQDYIVDGATRVRELTISTPSRSLIRIYNIAPLTPANPVASRINDLQRKAEGKTGGDDRLPVKVFPTTTHENMVEYRVSSSKMIDELFQHLEAAMLEYHARYLIPEQRPNVVRQITVSE